MTMFIIELSDLLSMEPLFQDPNMFDGEVDFSVLTNLPNDGASELTPIQLEAFEERMLEAFEIAVERSPEYDAMMLAKVGTFVEENALRVTPDGIVALDVESMGSFVSADGTFDELDMTRGDPDLLELFIE
jgi:hypothetical protein